MDDGPVCDANAAARAKCVLDANIDVLGVRKLNFEHARELLRVVGGLVDRHEAQGRVEALSPRERDVLEGLAQGRANKAIAYDLGISSRTVEVCRASLARKLGVQTLAQTLRIAFAAGMGRPP